MGSGCKGERDGGLGGVLLHRSSQEKGRARVGANRFCRSMHGCTDVVITRALALGHYSKKKNL